METQSGVRDETVVAEIEEVLVVENPDGQVQEVLVVEEVVVVDEVVKSSHVNISAEILGEPETRRHFHVERDATLLEVLEEGAGKLGVELLPPKPETPLDHLRGIYEHHTVGEPLDLSLTVAEFLDQPPTTHHFAVELVRAFRVNTRWRVAPTTEMTPVAILSLFDLSPTEYSLYHPHEKEPLPPNAPVHVRRGECFEAQRDGKYGRG
jgi:hypothetical protein